MKQKTKKVSPTLLIKKKKKKRKRKKQNLQQLLTRARGRKLQADAAISPLFQVLDKRDPKFMVGRKAYKRAKTSSASGHFAELCRNLQKDAEFCRKMQKLAVFPTKKVKQKMKKVPPTFPYKEEKEEEKKENRSMLCTTYVRAREKNRAERSKKPSFSGFCEKWSAFVFGALAENCNKMQKSASRCRKLHLPIPLGAKVLLLLQILKRQTAFFPPAGSLPLRRVATVYPEK